MKKNQYSVVIFNSHSQYNKSLIISKVQIYIFIVSMISMIGFIGFLSYKTYFLQSTVYEKNNVVLKTLDGISFSPPINGTAFITAEKHSTHHGIDIACDNNEDVKSISDGVVIFKNFLEDYGNTIIILHDKNIISKYCHLENSNIEENDTVRSGQVIAKAGKTGKLAKGVHLHFEIWQNNRILDPLEIIKEYKEINVSVKK